MPAFVDPTAAAVLDGTAPGATADARLAAAWLHAHDLAAAALGSAPQFFGDQPRANALMAALEKLGDAPVGDMVALAEAHVAAAKDGGAVPQ